MAISRAPRSRLAWYSASSGGVAPVVPPASVQELGNYTSTVSAASHVMPVNKVVTVGDTIVVNLSHYSLPTTTVITDNLGNVYSAIASVSYPSPVFYSRLFVASVTVGGLLTAITAAFTPNKGFVTLCAHEFSGIDIATVIDTGDTTGSSATATWANGIAIPANGIVIGGAACNNQRDFTAGPDSGVPLTSISVGAQAGAAIGADPSNAIFYAIGDNVAAFTGTAGLLAVSAWVGTAATFEGI